MGGLWKTAPLLGCLFLVQALSLAGIPPLSGFWGKFVIISESLRMHQYWLAAAALLASILTMVSMMKIWLNAFWKKGEPLDEDPHPESSTTGMTVIVCVMALISLGIGLNAEFFLNISTKAANSLMDQSIYRDSVLQITGKGNPP